MIRAARFFTVLVSRDADRSLSTIASVSRSFARASTPMRVDHRAHATPRR
jgi:hypothetical protein